VWPDLKDQISVEEAQLHQLLAVHQPLLDQVRTQAPSAIELSALAALLHSFYTESKISFAGSPSRSTEESTREMAGIAGSSFR
jgi:hypothetical protein